MGMRAFCCTNLFCQVGFEVVFAESFQESGRTLVAVLFGFDIGVEFFYKCDGFVVAQALANDGAVARQGAAVAAESDGPAFGAGVNGDVAHTGHGAAAWAGGNTDFKFAGVVLLADGDDAISKGVAVETWHGEFAVVFARADDDFSFWIAHTVAKSSEDVIPEWVDVGFSDIVEADFLGGGGHDLGDVVLLGEIGDGDEVVWRQKAVVNVDGEGIGAVFVQGNVSFKFHCSSSVLWACSFQRSYYTAPGGT